VAVLSSDPRYEPGKALNSYTPPNIIIPQRWEDARSIIEERIIKDAYATNAREIGQYVEDEIVTGQQWSSPNDPNTFQQTFRKVINLGGLVDYTATPTQTEAHGLTVDSGFTVTRIYGTASDQGTMYMPLPFTDSAGVGNIELCMDGTNIILRSTVDYSAFTVACVVVEFIRE
jgi:hypothetical protein